MQHQPGTTRCADENLKFSKAYGLRALLCVLVSTILAACTNSSPNISQEEHLPPIELDVTRYQSKTLASFDLGLNGRVVKVVDRLEISMDGGATWQKLDTNTGSTLNINQTSCTDKCGFSASLSDIGTQWPRLLQIPIGEEFQSLVRGQSRFGMTAATPFYIKHLKAGFFAVGALGITQVGASAKTLTSGDVVQSGRLEAKSEHRVSP